MSYLLHYFNVRCLVRKKTPFFIFWNNNLCIIFYPASTLLLSFLTYFVIPSLFLLSVFLLSAFFYVYIYCNQDCFSQSFSFTSSNSIFFLSIDSLSGKHKFQNGGVLRLARQKAYIVKWDLKKARFPTRQTPRPRFFFLLLCFLVWRSLKKERKVRFSTRQQEP